MRLPLSRWSFLEDDGSPASLTESRESHANVTGWVSRFFHHPGCLWPVWSPPSPCPPLGVGQTHLALPSPDSKDTGPEASNLDRVPPPPTPRGGRRDHFPAYQPAFPKTFSPFISPAFLFAGWGWGGHRVGSQCPSVICRAGLGLRDLGPNPKRKITFNTWI